MSEPKEGGFSRMSAISCISLMSSHICYSFHWFRMLASTNSPYLFPYSRSTSSTSCSCLTTSIFSCTPDLSCRWKFSHYRVWIGSWVIFSRGAQQVGTRLIASFFNLYIIYSYSVPCIQFLNYIYYTYTTSFSNITFLCILRLIFFSQDGRNNMQNLFFLSIINKFKQQSMLRTISSDSCRRKGRTPEHMDDLERRRMKIMTRHRQKWEGYGSSLSKRETQAYTGSKFRETGTTFDLRKQQDWRVRSSSNFYPGSKIQFKQQNESSQLDAWSLPKNQHNPLSIFKELSSEKVKSQKERSKSLMKGAKEGNGTRKFLRKGTAINRAIMVTLLRSKINPVVYDSPHSRTTHHDNKLLSAELKHQIPLQLRDAIGCEQMLRMSHIYTGANLKTDDLHVSVNKYIAKAHNMGKSSVIDDDETLKSIKRW